MSDLNLTLGKKLNGCVFAYAPMAQDELRLSIEKLMDQDLSDDDFYSYQKRELSAAYFSKNNEFNPKPYAFSDGIAVIPVHGSLINRLNGSYGFITGYSYIRNMVYAAVNDSDVTGIVLDINSFGGECSGCFELAQYIRDSSKTKPIVSFVDSHAYSAAYAIASSADKVYATESAGVGSIGVVLMHYDVSEAVKNAGVKVNFIYAGDHKVDGNPYQELSEEVRSRFQASVDKSYARFVDTVSKNRLIDKQVVVNTKADTFDSETAIRLGLIDAVSTPNTVIDTFKKINKSGEVLKMSETTKPAEQANLDAVSQEAALAERTRIAAIMNCEHAKDRPALSSHLAFSTSMSAEDAVSMLAVAGVEVKTATAAQPTSFADRMSQTPNPVVTETVQVEQKAENPLIAARNKARGV